MYDNFKKLIAPIIITIIIIGYLIINMLFLLVFDEHMPFIINVIFGSIFLGLISVCAYVLHERIKEVESGEEDDISKY